MKNPQGNTPAEKEPAMTEHSYEDRILSASDIFAIDDFESKKIYVPQWKGSVYIKTMTGTERDAFESSTVKVGKDGKQEQDMGNFRARFLSNVITDENGVKLFKNARDVAMLGNKAVPALDLLFKEAQELNSMSQDDVEKLTEGFEEVPDEPSTSD
jgi:hypothetical protein